MLVLDGEWYQSHLDGFLLFPLIEILPPMMRLNEAALFQDQFRVWGRELRPEELQILGGKDLTESSLKVPTSFASLQESDHLDFCTPATGILESRGYHSTYFFCKVSAAWKPRSIPCHVIFSTSWSIWKFKFSSICWSQSIEWRLSDGQSNF